jgi:hypothetical protein
LRLGTQGERCDFFAIRLENEVLVAECVEVKTAKGKPRSIGDLEIEAARQQLIATIGAVREGLGDSAIAERSGHYLAAPRNEMLKEVLVHGCMARYAPRELRAIWAGWLERLFGQQPETPNVRGLIVNVALGSAESTKAEFMPGLPEVRLEHITEVEIQLLLSHTRLPESEPIHVGEELNPSSINSAIDVDDRVRLASHDKNLEEKEEQGEGEPHIKVSAGHSKDSPTEIGIVLGKSEDDAKVCWQPSISGNPHMMIAGLPGMGKTTCLVSMCYQLAARGITPIVFSYHDDIDEQLSNLFSDLRLVDCSNLGFNPMRVPGSQANGHLENSGQMRDIFAAIFPELGDLQRELIRTAVKASYEAKGWGRLKPQEVCSTWSAGSFVPVGVLV